MADTDVLRLELRSATVEGLDEFVRENSLEFACRPTVRKEEGVFIADVYASEGEVQRARASRSAAGVEVRVVENMTESEQRRQAEVGKGNRFGARQVPRGLGRKV
jgi:hypothetical protein